MVDCATRGHSIAGTGTVARAMIGTRPPSPATREPKRKEAFPFQARPALTVTWLRLPPALPAQSKVMRARTSESTLKTNWPNGHTA